MTFTTPHTQTLTTVNTVLYKKDRNIKAALLTIGKRVKSNNTSEKAKIYEFKRY